ncbi:NAD(P)/FAD-dependent oxidoreductase [Lysobacter korlensis]|uniref:NAD(P)/FAD-dependent oxidoreductase n=1 Tax=Lysobacter korlensis TaxID=553636 RepID=A0ABV6RZS7_9GAMM
MDTPLSSPHAATRDADRAPAAPYRQLSLWHDTVPDDLTPRAPLDGKTAVDVAILGGGLTGLWTAHYLLERSPGARILILERDIAGFGASGRNGGWCSALFPKSTAALARMHGLEQALAMRRATIATVDEVGRVSGELGIDCDFVKGGTLAFARSQAQLTAARADVAEAERYGVDPLELHDAGSGRRRPRRVEELPELHRFERLSDRSHVFDPNCARLHPAKLVRGLARSLEERGVRIAEQTEVLDWRPGAVRTTRGIVRAESVVVATEGYGAALPKTRRTVLPLYSLMIATEPLPAEVWDEIGIEHGQTFTDYRHLLIYGQRTADDRIAFGGRGARYHWGSDIRADYDRVDRVFRRLWNTLVDLFPPVADAAITHRWGGPLGIPRDWHASVAFDPATRIGRAGGYVGDGLSTTNLAGRTLADLLSGTESDLTRLPWVNHASPRWEPEPLRFIGANAGLVGMAAADVEERITRRPSVAARLIGPLVGK